MRRRSLLTALGLSSVLILACTVVLAVLTRYGVNATATSMDVQDQADTPTSPADEPEQPGFHIVAFPPAKVSLDLGYVGVSDELKLTLSIANSLGRDVSVREVKSDCACLRIQEAPNLLHAFDRSELTALYETADNPMRERKRLAFLTDDEEYPALLVELSADVGRPLTASPDVVHLDASGADKAEGIVSVHNRGAEPVRLLYSTSSDRRCLAVIPDVVIEPNGRADITVVADIAGSKGATHNARVSIHTDCRTQGTLKFQARYTVLED